MRCRSRGPGTAPHASPKARRQTRIAGPSVDLGPTCQRSSPVLHDSGSERVTRAESDLIEVAHHDPVCAQQAGLRIADPVAFAEVADDGCARASWVAACWETVMLDLVVEAPEREVRRPAAAVLRTSHLTPEKVDLLVVRDDGHAGVVRGERTSQEQAE